MKTLLFALLLVPHFASAQPQARATFIADYCESYEDYEECQDEPEYPDEGRPEDPEDSNSPPVI